MWQHSVAGALFGMGFLIFIDGAIVAKNKNFEMTFVDTLGVIFSILGLVLFTMVDVRAISGGGDDDETTMMMGGGGGDDNDSSGMTARVLFFISAFFQLTGFSITVWRLVYWSNSSRNEAWIGWAEMLQTMIAMVSAGFLCYGNVAATRGSSD